MARKIFNKLIVRAILEKFENTNKKLLQNDN